jgi:hypothetical protein
MGEVGDLHYSSGMPVYMQKVVEGSEDEYEKKKALTIAD